MSPMPVDRSSLKTALTSDSSTPPKRIKYPKKYRTVDVEDELPTEESKAKKKK